MNEKISAQLKALTAFCRKYPGLVNYLDEFPKLYEFSMKYPTLISHADEALSAYIFMKEFYGQISPDEMVELVRLVETLKELENVETTDNFRVTEVSDDFGKSENTILEPEVEIVADAETETVEVEVEVEAIPETVPETEVEAITTEVEVEPESEAEVETEVEAEIEEAVETESEVEAVEAEVNPSEPEDESESNAEVAEAEVSASKRRALTEAEDKKLRELIGRGYSYSQIAKMVGCNGYNVSNFLVGNSKTWSIAWIEKLNALDLENLPDKPNGRKSKNKTQDAADEAPEEPA